MGLAELVADVEAGELTLALYNPAEAGAVDAVADALAARNVAVTEERTDTGRPADVAVLRSGSTVLASTSVPELRAAFTAAPPGRDGLGIDVDALPAPLRHLPDVTFTSRERSDLLAAAREVEDRALRARGGTLRAGFQTVANLRAEAATYEALVDAGVETHVYAVPGDATPKMAGVRGHLRDEAELARSWFVVFDGGPPGEPTALVAEERADGFAGFWSYDPDVVARAEDYLAAAYGDGEPLDGGD
jgi:hypothetical protein